MRCHVRKKVLQEPLRCAIMTRDDAKMWARVKNVLSNFPTDMLNVPIGGWALSVVVDVGTDNPSIVGTAFPIRTGVFVTAKHILTEFQEATEPKKIGRPIKALQVFPDRRFVTWRMKGAIVHRTADMAILFSDPSDRNPEIATPSWKISKEAPRINEWVGAFGNVYGRCRIVSRNASGGGRIEIGSEGKAEFGLVKRVYKDYRDRVMLPCPCFEVGAKFSPGMSGGPVLNERSEICGIVSSSIESANSSHVVTLWPSLPQIYGGPLE